MSALGHLPRRTHARLAAAAAVLLVVLLGTAPAWASTWSVTVDGPLPVGWVADPGQQQVWKAAGYESWVWSFNDVRDPARPDR